MMVRVVRRATARWRTSAVGPVTCLLPGLLALALAAAGAPSHAEPKRLDPRAHQIVFAGVPVTVTSVWELDHKAAAEPGRAELSTVLELRLNDFQSRFDSILRAAAAYRDPCAAKMSTTYVRLDRLKEPIALSADAKFELAGEVETWSCLDGIPTTRVELEERKVGGQTIRVPAVKTFQEPVRLRSQPASFRRASFALVAGLRESKAPAADGEVAVRVVPGGEPDAILDRYVRQGLAELASRFGDILSAGFAASGPRAAFPAGLDALKPQLRDVDFKQDGRHLLIRYKFLATAPAEKVSDFRSQAR